uniref:Homeobox domain-containing protein n=1 Tax=Ursus maritimus TaxID=29073 RepID=A0A452USW9_URSMA
MPPGVQLHPVDRAYLSVHRACARKPVHLSSGPLPPGSRRRRLVLTPAQKGALHAWFQHNLYPGIATRERLARELHIPESRIQLRQTLLSDSVLFLERVAKEGRRKRTSISPSETSILLQAFEKNRFPSIATREHLARLTGLPEPRIQVHCPSMTVLGGPGSPGLCPQKLSASESVQSSGKHAGLCCGDTSCSRHGLCPSGFLWGPWERGPGGHDGPTHPRWPRRKPLSRS